MLIVQLTIKFYYQYDESNNKSSETEQDRECLCRINNQVSKWCFTPSQPLRLSQGVTHFVDTQYLLKICPC